jgi:Holliday junction resolvase RusA-like endonuclease
VDDGQVVDGGVKKFYHESPGLIAQVTTVEEEGVFS